MKLSAAFVLLALMSIALTGCVRYGTSANGGPSREAKAAMAADAQNKANASQAANANSAAQANDGNASGITPTVVKPDDSSPSITGRTTTLLAHPIDAMEAGYAVRWATSINVPKNQRLAYVKVLDDLIVTVEHPSNMISAISVKSGKLLWRVAIGLSVDVTFDPVRIDDKILVNTETNLYMLSADEGKYLDRSNLRSPVRNGPAVIGEYVVFGGADGMVFGHDTRVGYEKWSYNLQTQILVAPVAVSNQIFVGTSTGRYAAFSGREGQVLWQGRAFGRISNPPAVSNLGIFVAAEDGNLYSLNRSSGEDRWIYRYTAPLKASPIALKNAVYQPLPTGELLALQGTNGKEIWTINTKSRPVAHTSRGLVFIDDGKLEIRDPATGKLITSAATKKLQKVIPVGGTTLLLIASDGRMMRLDAN